LVLFLYAAGHDSKPNSAENLRLRPPSKTKESLNLSAGASAHTANRSMSAASANDRHVDSLDASADCAAAVEPSSNGAGSLLRPTLTLSRKGHGHRHRRAVRRASSGVSCAAAMPPSSVEVDPREPQVVLSESALLTTHRSRGSRPHGPVETVALQTFGTSRASFASPVQFDLSSLSSYKETSPESETSAPHTSMRLLKLDVSCPSKINLTEPRRQSENRLSSLSQSRDSLEMYKNRAQRKMSVDGVVLSESAVIHAVAEPACSTSNFADDNSADHVITCARQQSSDSDRLATIAIDQIQPEIDSSTATIDRLPLSRNVIEVPPTTDAALLTRSGSSPTESKSESSNTLTPAADLSSDTVRRRTAARSPASSKLAASSSSSSRKLTSLFCGASHHDDDDNDDDDEGGVRDIAGEIGEATGAFGWLFSTDSEDSPSSVGTYPYFCMYTVFHFSSVNQIKFTIEAR